MFFKPLTLRNSLFLSFVIGTIASLSSCSYLWQTKPSALDQRKTLPLGQKLRDLPFFPINGDVFRFSRLKDVKAVVIAMRKKTCPDSEKSGPLLSHLEQKYSKQGIKFIYSYAIGVDPKQREKEKALEEANKDLQLNGFKGPYTVDSKQKLISALGVRSSDELFVLDPKRQLIYRGSYSDLYKKKHESPPPPPQFSRD